MPKDTKTLGNNKARAWESLGFAHKKRRCVVMHDAPSFLFITIQIGLFSSSCDNSKISLIYVSPASK